MPKAAAPQPLSGNCSSEAFPTATLERASGPFGCFAAADSLGTAVFMDGVTTAKSVASMTAGAAAADLESLDGSHAGVSDVDEKEDLLVEVGGDASEDLAAAFAGMVRWLLDWASGSAGCATVELLRLTTCA
eukprot:2328349-Pleurochrysis_carterae.AAC.4